MLAPGSLIVALGLAWPQAQPSDQLLIDLVRDALTQAEKHPALKRGEMRFEIELFSHVLVNGKYQPAELVRVDATMLWNGEDVLWTYKMSDPSSVFTESLRRATPLESAATEYCLLDERIVYYFNYHNNSLHKHPFLIFSQLRPLAVLPQHLWFRCCPPHHESGSPWAQVIDGPVPDPASGLRRELRRDGDHVIQTWTGPDDLRATTVYSLAHCGHVIEYSSTNKGENAETLRGTFTWEKRFGDVCVLTKCWYEQYRPEIVAKGPFLTYSFTLRSIDLSRPVPPSSVSLAALKPRLPRDVIVYDNVTKTSYYLNKPPATPERELKALSDEARSRGFLKRDR